MFLIQLPDRKKKIYIKIMYDYKAYREAWTKFMWEFYEDMDTFMAGGSPPGPALDIMDNAN
jgi:hypothetical protein